MSANTLHQEPIPRAPRCGVRTMAAFKRATPGPLPRRIGWWHEPRFKLPGLSESGTRSVICAAFQLAQTFVPIEMFRAQTAAAALIVLKVGRPEDFDGVGGTLAMADMRSLYDPTPREIWYDPAEMFALGAASMATLALPVTCHEIGHTLGFGHGTSGLMAAYYDPQVTTPTKAELRKFYRAYPSLAPPEDER